MFAILRSPLWPAGHLPHEGGDPMSLSLSPIADVAGTAPSVHLLISPVAGEMSGGTEGGARAPYLS
ncbi:MAG: hypothetical protein EOQ64_18965 [Mesorhizobium sp.]|nr:MAG: hypothetical protein EOQ64_18965 [Mesorhizobium sp.]RWH39186.1 MAG: hypothetical protein EOQ78_22565 [Mesorhizobium sp.]